MSVRYLKKIDEYGLVVYDLVGRAIVGYMSEWAHHMRRNCKLMTVDQRADHVLRFLEFLHARNRAIESVTDAFLVEFRKFELSSVLQNSRSRQSQRAARQTVNEKLWAVYQLLEWMRDEGLLESDAIGRGVQFRVRLNDGTPALRGDKRGPSKYPLLYKRTGRGSRHSVRLHVSRAMFDQAVSELNGQPNEYLAVRDSLMLDIAGAVGIRRASVSSLEVGQFVRDHLESTKDDTVLVQPRAQKFGYEDEFHFPVHLALRVLNFIENERELLLNERGSEGRKRAGDAVFLSFRSCAPLSERYFSCVVGKMFRKLGSNKGVAVHAGRRLFAVEAVECELDERLRLGLDTSVRSVCAAVAQKLGQKNPDSVHPYVVAELSRRAAAARSKRLREGVPRTPVPGATPSTQ